MITIAIDKSALRAIAIFAARKDVRYYLNGVCLEIGRDESRLVATDGHHMAVYRIRESSEVTETKSYIIPIEMFKGIKAPGKRDCTTKVLIDIDGAEITIRDIRNNTSQSGKLIDGKFPDWRSVCNITPSGDIGHYNPIYVMHFYDAAEELGVLGANMLVHHNGELGAIVTIKNPDFFGVLMPMRSGSEAVTSAPKWVISNTTTELAVAA